MGPDIAVFHPATTRGRCRIFWVRLATVIALIMSLVLTSTGAAAQQALPDVDVTLVVEVSDPTGWRVFHAEVLGTPRQAPKRLDVSITAGTGGSRGITVQQPKFTVSLVKGAPMFQVVVTGKIAGADALGTLGAFEQAVHENHGQPGEALVGLYYGLVSVGADLIEMHVSRP